MSGVDDPRSQLLGKSTARESVRDEEKGAKALRSRRTLDLRARAVAALEHRTGRRVSEVEREHAESRARFAVRFYFVRGGKGAFVRRCRSATPSRGGVPPWGGDTRRRSQTERELCTVAGRGHTGTR